ncbi:hypothetical protein D3C87_1962030 [compost metagenome]
MIPRQFKLRQHETPKHQQTTPLDSLNCSAAWIETFQSTLSRKIPVTNLASMRAKLISH